MDDDTPIYDSMLHELATLPAEMFADARKGDQVCWMGVEVTVTRVAADHSWVDLAVRDPEGLTWTKRLPLPPAGEVHQLDRGETSTEPPPP